MARARVPSCWRPRPTAPPCPARPPPPSQPPAAAGPTLGSTVGQSRRAPRPSSTPCPDTNHAVDGFQPRHGRTSHRPTARATSGPEAGPGPALDLEPAASAPLRVTCPHAHRFSGPRIVQKRVTQYHISESSAPRETGAAAARCGGGGYPSHHPNQHPCQRRAAIVASAAPRLLPAPRRDCNRAAAAPCASAARTTKSNHGMVGPPLMSSNHGMAG